MLGTGRGGIPYWYLGAGATLAIVAAVAPQPAINAILLSATAAAIAAIIVGLRAYRPRRPAVWMLVGGAFAAWGIAALAGLLVNSSATPHFQLIALASIPGYVLLFAATLTMLRACGRAPLGIVDASIVLLALTTVLWPLTLEPNIRHIGQPTYLGATAIVVTDLIVVTLLLRVAFSPTGRLRSFMLLLTAMTVMALGDVVNVSRALNGSAATRVVCTAYVLAYVLGGAAALDPSMRLLPLRAGAEVDVSPRRSIIVLASALFAPLVGLVLNQYLLDGSATTSYLLLGVIVVAAVIARIARLLRQLDVRLRAEASEQKFRMVFESAGIGISTGSDGMLSETNEAYQAMLGYSAAELANMHYADITHPDDIELDRAASAEVMSGTRASSSVDKRYIRRDGAVMWARVTVTNARDGRFGIGLIEDITDRHELEEERKRLLTRTVEVAEAERMALAADLHDGPIQHLTAVALALDLLAVRLERGRFDDAAARARAAREDLAKEMVSLRRLMSVLRPPILDERGIGAALTDCADALLSGDAIDVRVECDLRGKNLAPELETGIYRVVREALVNVGKHAHARSVVVSLSASASEVDLVIGDDGQGFMPADTDDDHYGLITMRERVESLDGTWELVTGPGEGTLIRATLPLKAPTTGAGGQTARSERLLTAPTLR